MRTLYIDCGMGAAGDMLTAALLELLPEADKFVEKLNQLNLSKVTFQKEVAEKCGIRGTHMHVFIDGEEEHTHDHGHEHIHELGHEHTHEHGHTHEHEHTHEHTHFHAKYSDVVAIIDSLNCSNQVKNQVKEIYHRIAQAESTVHGVPVTEIHFHEVGKLDAIADVTAVCMLLEELAVDEIVVSPIHVGSGYVHCAHGILPVPAPATAQLLRGCPIYSGDIDGELCTPTGAALLAFFADRFGAMPTMSVEQIGYGMGKKDFKKANCVRVMLGETANEQDTVTQLSCNLDDMTGEALGFAMERLFEAKALEVFTVPCSMKKDRPGIVLSVICENEDVEQIVACIFKYTTTIGIRKQSIERFKLQRSMEAVDTPYGQVHKKCVSGYGTKRFKYEYEDLAQIAREQGMSLDEVKALF